MQRFSYGCDLGAEIADHPKESTAFRDIADVRESESCPETTDGTNALADHHGVRNVFATLEAEEVVSLGHHPRWH
jgi:hypothetical protein